MDSSHAPQISYLEFAVADTQSTIRAIDVKLGFLFTLLLIPLTELEGITSVLLSARSASECVRIFYVLSDAVFGISWTVALCITFRGLIGISNPSKHIKDAGSAKGTFYLPTTYSFNFTDLLANRKSVISKHTIDEIASILPQDELSILSELIYEHAKLSYIREIKIYRHKAAFGAAAIWMISGLICWLFHAALS